MYIESRAAGGEGLEKSTHIEEVKNAIAGKIGKRVRIPKGTQKSTDIEEIDHPVVGEVRGAGGAVGEADDLET